MVYQDCPKCDQRFPRSRIEAHAATCGDEAQMSPPSVSTTPLPRGGSPNPTVKPGQSGSKGNHVACEICGVSLPDLAQLRNHMQRIHQEWILIDDRPLLTCSTKLKCLLRFFTDQGLERHLLGAHGLVTTGLQEAADKGQDTGKCPVCTKVS